MLSVLLLLLGQEKVLNYDILRDGKPIGKAKILVKITQDGGKRTDSKLELAMKNQKVDMHTTMVWAKSGRPTLKVIQFFDPKGAELSRTRVEFRATDFLVTETIGSKLTKTTKPIPANAEIRDLPEFWFLRDQPEKGRPYQYLVFNSTSLNWDSAISTYIGETEKNVDGKLQKRQTVSQTIGSKKNEIRFDENGFPVETSTNDGILIIAKF